MSNDFELPPTGNEIDEEKLEESIRHHPSSGNIPLRVIKGGDQPDDLYSPKFPEEAARQERVGRISEALHRMIRFVQRNKLN